MGERKRGASLIVGLALAVFAAPAAAPAATAAPPAPAAPAPAAPAGAATGPAAGATPTGKPTHGQYERKPAARHDRQRLDRVMARIESAQPWAAVADPAITEYYVDERRGVVSVGVERVTPALRGAARRTFGTAVALHQADRYHRTSRGDDRAPHTAGAVIETELGVCTSGFGVSRNGSTYFLGTAHCFRATGGAVTNGGQVYGRVAERVMSDRGPDASLIASDFGPRMYVGGPESDTSRAVRGARTPASGASVCTSGAGTGATCSGVRRQADICVVFGDGITTCHLTRAVSTDGTPLVQAGDSGGPVYTGRTYAVGMTVGGNRDGTELLYHSIGYLLDLWDARLLTQTEPQP